jgi:disulfide bond formation protein DsbB
MNRYAATANHRYAAIAWPWTILILAVALVGQELLLQWLGAQPALTEAAYRVFVMTLGVASLALILLPPRRAAYALGFLVCAALMGWAFWLQYGEGLEPCPLCMFQRVCVTLVGLVFLIAAIQNPGRRGAAFYAVLTLIIAGAGAGFAARQIWLQALPKDQVPACGMGLSYMMETLPFTAVITKVLEGSGECAEKGWVFLGLSIAGWTFVFFASMIVAAIALVRRN